MNKTRLLIVEDDPTLRMALVDTLASSDTEIFEAPNGKEALALLMRENIDLVLSDVQMDEMDGTELLAHVRQHYPNLPFVMMTAHGTVQHAVAAMRDGATDYLQKPFEASVLKALVERMAATNRVSGQEMIAEDPATQAVLALATRVAQSDAAVMISGESGCGKEVLARVIHEQSPRASGPFVALNCAAIPETMLESILFGYEKGAFTGAQSAQAGKFEQANGGTLLLDEISEMALELQAKLLRVLQEREVERLGGKATIPLDVRVLASLALKKSNLPTTTPPAGGEENKQEKKAPVSDFDPFVPPFEPHLFIADLSSTHRLLYNKFCMANRHMIVTTSDFERQDVPMSAADMTAILMTMYATNSFVFFNRGFQSGMSILHKHF